MIARGGVSWQVIIADLALILFMVSVAAIEREGTAEAAPALVEPVPALGEPTAIYRQAGGGPSLQDWLADQAPDPRRRLTILARYPAGEALAASENALAMARSAGTEGASARILLEPGRDHEVLAYLAYDDAPAEWHEDCVLPAEGGRNAVGGKDLPCE